MSPMQKDGIDPEVVKPQDLQGKGIVEIMKHPQKVDFPVLIVFFLTFSSSPDIDVGVQ